MSWPTRVVISVMIPLICGIGVAATGLPRKAYNNAPRFWALTGLYDPTPIPVPKRRQPEKRAPNLTLTLRYVTEGALYTVTIIPAFIMAIFIYDRLTFRYSRDGYLRCLQCGHILQGLTAPRCPECGKVI